MENIRILAVDDDEGALYMIKTKCGKYEVHTETDPLTALERIRKEKYAVLIVDYIIGRKMNGIDLLQFISEIYPPNSYVALLCTSYGTKELFKAEYGKNLFFDFIEKPFEGDNLEAAVERAVREFKNITNYKSRNNK